VSPVPQEHVDQMKNIIREVLGSAANPAFLLRIDAVLADWSAGKLNAAQTSEKIVKMVSLFIDADKAEAIGSRCAPIVMKDTSSRK